MEILKVVVGSLKIIIAMVQNWSNRADKNGDVVLKSEEILPLHKTLSGLIKSLEDLIKHHREG